MASKNVTHSELQLDYFVPCGYFKQFDNLIINNENLGIMVPGGYYKVLFSSLTLLRPYKRSHKDDFKKKKKKLKMISIAEVWLVGLYLIPRDDWAVQMLNCSW